jgi:uncharacterized protein (DUF305 family)
MTALASWLLRLTLVLSAVGALVAAAGCTRIPSDDSVEAGFARDMATHHAQAVDMAFIIRDATTDESLRALSTDIIVTQSAQRGMFMAWLQLWGLPQASARARMTWMAPAASGGSSSTLRHSHAEGAATGLPIMAGMATDAELDALRRATGRDAEALFLQLMIRHHEGGVLMAKTLLERSSHEDVVAIVRGIDSGQTGEIATMTEMLAARGAQPMPPSVH